MTASANMTALKIAKYVIDKCTMDNKPISNLKLQKILYHIQQEFLSLGMVAFDDEIIARSFGPVVPYVYRTYCGFGGSPIRLRYNIDLDPNDALIVDSVIRRWRNLEPWEDNNNEAWSKTYQNGKGNYRVIKKSLILSEVI